MSGILAVETKTYMQQASMRLHLVARVAWPIGTKYYCEQGSAVNSSALGVHLPIITGMSPVRRVPGDRDGGLQAFESTLDLLDHEKVISDALASSDGDEMEGSAILVRYAPGDTSIGNASWSTICAGVVEQIDFTASRAVRLKIRPDDKPLRKDAPKHRVHLGDWPHAANNSDTSVLDKYMPTYFGKWDSRSAGGGGAVECLNVDDRKGVNNRWVWQQGRAKRILAAYQDDGSGGRSLLATSAYSLEYPVRGGRAYSGLVRTAATGRFTPPVTVDFEGLTDDPDGTGALVENPASQIALFANAYVWGDHGTEAAYPTSAPINATYLAATEAFFDDQGIKGSLRVVGPAPAANILDEWASSFPFIRLFWTFRSGSAELAIRHRDWRDYPYTSDPLLRWVANDDGSKMVPSRIRRERVDRYVARYLVSGVTGEPTRSLAVRDSRLGYDASEDLQLLHGLAALG